MVETVPGGGQYRGIIFDMGGAGIPVRKTVTFTGAANLGAIGDVPLFTVTGDILVVSLIPICTADLVENSVSTLMSLGVTDIVALFIAATEPKDIDEDDVWDAVAPATTAVAIPALLKDIIVVGDANNILATITNDTITDGVLEFNLRYLAISDGATVVAA